MILWTIVFLVILFLIIIPYCSAKARIDDIYKKYGHTEIAEKIIKKTIWVGETGEQLRDSLGPPVDIDERVLKTKKKETWKYYQKSSNRFGLKVTVEDGIVVGWDEKL